MTTPQNHPQLSQEDLTLIREVYARRVGHLAWFVKSIVLGLVAGLALGWLTTSIFDGMWLNPLTWFGAVWGGSLLTAISTRQGASVIKAILTAPLAFKKELSRRSAEGRKDQALLVARLKKD